MADAGVVGRLGNSELGREVSLELGCAGVDGNDGGSGMEFGENAGVGVEADEDADCEAGASARALSEGFAIGTVAGGAARGAWAGGGCSDCCGG